MKKVFRRTHDPIWHLQLGVAAIIGLQVITAHSFFPANKIILIALELVLLFALTAITPDGYHRISRLRRSLALILIGVVTAANIFSLIILLDALITGSSSLSGEELLINAATIYTTNIFLFALWYWEMDAGGPDRRAVELKGPDFLFPQMVHGYIASSTWRPGFTDYLYLSSTNVVNFASADTLPVSHRAKILMMIQALVSVATVVLVVSRAISLMQ